MSWTYTGEPFQPPEPFTGQVATDTVRFLIGDTVVTDPQLQDGEIIGLLSNNVGDVYQAAIEACRTLIARYARQVDKSSGNLSLSASQRAKNYQALITQLTAASIRHGGAPTIYAGGISQADMENDREDTDLVQPNFTVGGMDNRGGADDLNDGTGFSQVVPG